jgi:hypothetical protein
MTAKVGVMLSSLAFLAAAGCSTAPFQLALWNPAQIVNDEEDVHGARATVLYGRNGDVRGLDAGLGFARSRQMTGVQANGVGNWCDEDAVGTQIGGLLNVCKGNVAGVQIGGVSNGSENVTGVQIGGLLNVCENITGSQIGVLFNGCKGGVAGVQIDGMGNVCMGDMTGVQVSGLANACHGDVTGVQISGLANGWCKNMTGIQIGGMNWCAENMTGVQIGGIANICRPEQGVDGPAASVSGLQVALINYAQRLDGVQIGLINIVKGQWFPFVPLINFSFSTRDAEPQPATPKEIQP